MPPADDTLFEFSPDGRSLVFPDRNGREFHVLRLDSDAPPATFPHVSPINALFSPDSRSVAIGGNTDAVTVLDLESGRSVELAGHGAGGSPFSYASDDLLVTAGQGGTMVWNMAPEGVAELGNLRTEGTLWFDSQPGAGDTITALLLSGPEEVTAASIDLSTGASRPVARFWSANFAGAVASPDGTLVAGSSLRRSACRCVVDVASGDTIATLRPCELVKTVDAVRLLALVAAPLSRRVAGGCGGSGSQRDSRPPHRGVGRRHRDPGVHRPRRPREARHHRRGPLGVPHLPRRRRQPG